MRLAERYGIEPWQFYTATVDNARNGIKAVTLLQEKQEDDILQQFFPNEFPDDEDDEYDPAFMDPRVEIYEQQLNGHLVDCVRCGAHTLNLVVKDATKEHETDMKRIVEIVKAYRKINYSQKFKHTGVPLPPIPVKTRWNHDYMMTKSLDKNREFFYGLGVKFPELGKSNFVFIFPRNLHFKF